MDKIDREENYRETTKMKNLKKYYNFVFEINNKINMYQTDPNLSVTQEIKYLDEMFDESEEEDDEIQEDEEF